MTKTAGETAVIQQPHGGALLPGGKKGNKGGGRPPDEFKAKMREMASSDETLKYLTECVKGKHGAKAAVAAHKHVTERGYGKVAQVIEGNPEAPVEMRIIRTVVDARDP